MRERDPSYITPRIKTLLRKRNKLRRAGKMEQADYIAVTVNRLIVHNRSRALAGTSNTDTKQFWGLLKRTDNWGANKPTVANIEPNQINGYFASRATDPEYDRSAVLKAALRETHHATNFVRYTRDSMELILARIRKTLPANDNILYWIYRNCAHELSEVVTMLVNMSIDLGVVPSAWRTAVITSVPT